MVALHVLDHISNVIAVQVEMLLYSCLGNFTCRVRCEIAQIPALDEFFELSYAWVFRKLFCKRYYSQFMRIKFNITF